MQVSVASSSTCPSQLAPIDQTSNICTKLIKTQVGCITNVDSYSLYACTYVSSVRDISTIVCYHLHQVLFVEVTKLLRFLEKTTNIFAASGFHKIPRIIYCACALTTIRYWKITLYTVCSQFKHYVGLVNLSHSSSCPMFPYAGYLLFGKSSLGIRPTNYVHYSVQISVCQMHWWKITINIFIFMILSPSTFSSFR